MSVSFQSTTRTLALVAILAASQAAGAQTTTPQEPASEAQRAANAATAPATTNAAPANGVTQQSATSDAAATARIQALEDRIATLEKAEAKAKATAAAQPTVTAARDGLNIRSADNAFTFRLRGYVQSDARFFGAAGPVAPGSSTFLLRRGGAVFLGAAGKEFCPRPTSGIGQRARRVLHAHVRGEPTPPTQPPV